MMSEIRIPRDKVKALRNQKMTYEEIGLMYGVTRQRIWAIATNYTYKEYRTPRYKMYKRHMAGHSEPYLECIYCKEDRQNGTTTI